MLLLLFWGLTAGLLWYVYDAGWSWLTGVAAFILLSWNFRLLTMFVNKTVVVAGGGKLSVKHGPLPALGLFPRVELDVSELKQLYAVKHGPHYAVKGDLKDGKSTLVVAPLVTEEQALFVEQQLEHALGIVDFEVEGELARAMPERVAKASGAKTGNAAIGLVALAPVVVGGGIFAIIINVMETEVSGTLSVTRGNESFEFVPDDCRSGQPFGFFGVDVTDQKGQVVRLMNDPVRGPIVMVQRAGGSARPLPLSDCETVEVTVVHTNTTINDVRALDGSARLKCPGVRADLSFGNCH